MTPSEGFKPTTRRAPFCAVWRSGNAKGLAARNAWLMPGRARKGGWLLRIPVESEVAGTSDGAWLRLEGNIARSGPDGRAADWSEGKLWDAENLAVAEHRRVMTMEAGWCVAGRTNMGTPCFLVGLVGCRRKGPPRNMIKIRTDPKWGDVGGCQGGGAWMGRIAGSLVAADSNRVGMNQGAGDWETR